MMIGERPGQHEAERGRPFCVDAETKVLTADLRWIPIKEIRVGTAIMACDEQPPSGNGISGAGERCWRMAVVTAKRYSYKDCIKLLTEDGELVCTEDHVVLASGRKTNTGTYWREAGSLWASEGKDKKSNSLVKPFDVWESRLDYDTGWLAGLFDGEGYVTGSQGGFHRKRNVGFAQNLGPVTDRALNVIQKLGFSVLSQEKLSNIKYPESICYRHNLAGTFPEKLKFLGVVRPIRLIGNVIQRIERGGMRMKMYRRPTILSKTKVGKRRVVDISTSTGTFVANGFIVHNCGPAGEMLNTLLAAANLDRKEIYITNLVKSFSDYAKPTAEDIAAGEQELWEEIEAVQPEVICTLGTFATEWLLQRDRAEMEKTHGVPVRYENSLWLFKPAIVVPAFHPAAGLYSPETMANCLDDMLRVAQVLDGELEVREDKWLGREDYKTLRGEEVYNYLRKL